MFANNNINSKINEMLCSKVRSRRVINAGLPLRPKCPECPKILQNHKNGPELAHIAFLFPECSKIL